MPRTPYTQVLDCATKITGKVHQRLRAQPGRAGPQHQVGTCATVLQFGLTVANPCENADNKRKQRTETNESRTVLL